MSTIATAAALAGAPLLASFELLGMPAGLFVPVFFLPLVLTGFVLVLDGQQERIDRFCNLNDVE